VGRHRGCARRPCLLVTFFTFIVGPGKDCVFGYGFFVGFLALAIWVIATSIAQYSGVATNARELPPTEADSRHAGQQMLILQTVVLSRGGAARGLAEDTCCL
jgi:hypothetical protein